MVPWDVLLQAQDLNVTSDRVFFLGFSYLCVTSISSLAISNL